MTDTCERSHLRVLIAVDAGDASVSAVRAAKHLFGVDHVDYVLVNVAVPVVPIGVSDLAVGALPPVAIDREAVSLSDEEMHSLGAATGLPCEATESRVGDPVDVIVTAAEDQKADVIVVGTHQRGWVSRMLQSSVSEGIVRTASCPVLVVPSID